MTRPRILSLFSGYGGLDLAVEAATGGRVVAHCELEDAPSKVLARHRPDVPNLGDITTVHWRAVADDFGPVDVVCGGFPCQDLSYAGRGAGITEGTRSGLWTEMAEAVRVLRPRLVMLENVAAILARGADRVAGDLAALGYVGSSTCVRASDVGAPHRRDRWFAVAHPEDDQPGVQTGDGRRAAVGVAAAGAGRGDGAGDAAAGVQDVGRGPGVEREAVADAGVDGRGGSSQPHVGTQQPGQQASRRGDVDRRSTAVADADGAGLERARPARRRRTRPADHRDPTADTTVGERHEVERDRRCTPPGRAARVQEPDRGSGSDAPRWGDYGPAVDRWESITGQRAPAPAVDGRLNPDFVEWLMGVPIGYTAVDGVSRAQRLKMLGNGVVPQQATAAYTSLLTQHHQHKAA